MAHEALSTYLSDHLAGATLGCEQARQLEEMSEETSFGPKMTQVAMEIEHDRDSLVDLMGKLDSASSPVKQAGAWIAEKASRVKFPSGDRELGRYELLEALSLGVEGKRSLWTALERISDRYPELHATDLAGLIARAEAQRDALEAERLRTAEHVLGVGEPA